MRDGGSVAVSLKTVGYVTVALPLSALIFCLLLSLYRDFEKATYTHCEVPEFAPSISSVIGGFSPQSHVWNVCIALQSTPRLLFARMYYRYFKDRLSLGSATPRLVSLNFGLNIVENLSLLGLSFVTSSDIFELHEAFFITFMGTSMISMVLTMFYLYPHCGFQARSGDERRAIGYKKKLVKTSLGAAALALYFYWRHNEYCEPYVYSFFGLFEYVIVLCNIGYHGMVSLDFADSSVRTGPDQILLK